MRIRAAEHGISMEEEVRRILYATLIPPKKPSLVFKKYFGKKNGIDLDTSHTSLPHDPIDLNDHH